MEGGGKEMGMRNYFMFIFSTELLWSVGTQIRMKTQQSIMALGYSPSQQQSAGKQSHLWQFWKQ